MRATTFKPGAIALVLIVTSFSECAWSAETSALSDEPVPLQVDTIPARPRPILEIGDTFLGSGNISSGINLPTGAVWQPSFQAWGTFRTAVQSFDDGNSERISEWANRFDLFGQLNLTPTERVFIGLRPLDDEGRFTGYTFSPSQLEGGQSEFNGNVESLFFEGDFGEIFPNLDNGDQKGLDIGFSIGRQPIFFQEGLLLNDSIDAVGITRNNIRWFSRVANTRATFLYGWDNIHRADNIEDASARLFGFFTETDIPKSTINFDLIYVDADDNTGRGLYAGLSAVQRIGHFNTAFRVAFSEPLDDETPQVSRGTVVFGEVSWTPAYSHDIVYVNLFWVDGRYSSAARGPATGGPLGQTGILFAAVGLGRYGAALGNDAESSLGGAMGWQKFSNDNRRQLVFELGGRFETEGSNRDSIAVGARFQQAISSRFVARIDGFVSSRQDFDEGWGVRFEWITKL